MHNVKYDSPGDLETVKLPTGSAVISFKLSLSRLAGAFILKVLFPKPCIAYYEFKIYSVTIDFNLYN